MKQISIALAYLLVCFFISCNEKKKNNKPADVSEVIVSPIEGNWETVSFEVNGKSRMPEKMPKEFKMYNDGYFSFILFDSSGKFSLAASGTYEVDTNMYKETLVYSSGDTAYIGAKDWQKWEMKGDTLIFYGFEKAEMPDGKDVTKEWNANGAFIEKRVRAKR